MFIVGASYLSLLQAVAAKCSLPYVSLVSEVDADGSSVYGVEVVVPYVRSECRTHTIFLGTSWCHWWCWLRIGRA